jgi:hypothetical protein
MKTTLNIEESTMRRLKNEARRRGRTMSELVELALRRFLRRRPEAKRLAPLPRYSGGRLLVDVSDRDALYREMEGR